MHEPAHANIQIYVSQEHDRKVGSGQALAIIGFSKASTVRQQGSGHTLRKIEHTIMGSFTKTRKKIKN